MNKLRELAPRASENELKKMNKLAYSIIWVNAPDFEKAQESPVSIKMPHFPLESLQDAARLLVSEIFREGCRNGRKMHVIIVL